MDQAASEVHKLAKQGRDQYFSSTDRTSFFYHGSILDFLTAQHILSVKRARYYKRTKICFYYAVFAELMPKFVVRQQEIGFCLRQNVSFWMSFREHKSVKSVRERSILAVRIAKFGPFREPIRMLLFTTNQFSHIIKFNIWIDRLQKGNLKSRPESCPCVSAGSALRPGAFRAAILILKKPPRALKKS